MGSTASKASRAAGATARRYPKRPAPVSNSSAPSQRPPPPPPAQHQRHEPTLKPKPEAHTSRTDAVNLDASDPDFARQLRSIGPVQPSPTMSPSSTFNSTSATRPTAPDPRLNPAIMVLSARSKLQDEADQEFMAAGQRGHEGKQFLDPYTIRQILVQRDQYGKSAAEIEKSLGLKRGVVDRLGPRNLVGILHEVGRERREVDLV